MAGYLLTITLTPQVRRKAETRTSKCKLRHWRCEGSTHGALNMLRGMGQTCNRRASKTSNQRLAVEAKTFLSTMTSLKIKQGKRATIATSTSLTRCTRKILTTEIRDWLRCSACTRKMLRLPRPIKSSKTIKIDQSKSNKTASSNFAEEKQMITFRVLFLSSNYLKEKI